MTGRTNALSSMETYVSVAITNFTSFTAYYNDGESSTKIHKGTIVVALGDSTPTYNGSFTQIAALSYGYLIGYPTGDFEIIG